MAGETGREASYSIGAVARLTGLSEHLLRAWERRYGAVVPRRTPGGSRRYSRADVDRLRRLAAAVAAGHPISELADLDDEALEELAQASQGASGTGTPPARTEALDDTLAAIERLDARELERILGRQFAVLGPRAFARDFALPLLREIGDRWECGDLPVAAEHLASGLLRSFLGAALRATPGSAGEPPMLFATPTGERHEFGVLVAGLLAIGAGRNAIHLGPDLPVEEVVLAVERTGAAAVVLGLVQLERNVAEAYLEALRRRLPAHVELWVGGDIAPSLPPREGVVPLRDLDAFEARVLAFEPGPVRPRPSRRS